MNEERTSRSIETMLSVPALSRGTGRSSDNTEPELVEAFFYGSGRAKNYPAACLPLNANRCVLPTP